MLRNDHDCLFQNGTVDCKKEDCPPVKCDHPTFREGQCCPQCFSKYFKYIVPWGGGDFMGNISFPRPYNGSYGQKANSFPTMKHLLMSFNECKYCMVN